MIEFRSVGKEFTDGTHAVADFSLTIPSHTTTVFVGPSGYGKTMLLRSINRMVDLTEGQIRRPGHCTWRPGAATSCSTLDCCHTAGLSIMLALCCASTALGKLKPNNARPRCSQPSDWTHRFIENTPVSFPVGSNSA